MPEPVIKLDSSGTATVISYNVPEPTSYEGSNIIELGFADSMFTAKAKEIPENRKTKPSTKEVETAIGKFDQMGTIDPAVFPNVEVTLAKPGAIGKPKQKSVVDLSAPTVTRPATNRPSNSRGTVRPRSS